MKAIIKRIRRLEETVASPEFQKPHWVEVWRAQRAKRLGIPYEPRPETPGQGRVSWADAWRQRRAEIQAREAANQK
jgi:hypothetical protein